MLIESQSGEVVWSNRMARTIIEDRTQDWRAHRRGRPDEAEHQRVGDRGGEPVGLPQPLRAWRRPGPLA